ncbi:hypothetical protein INT43_005279 [Umbelopsis isabellina]|uniref:Uncharacterized protein n=1 Tax=Mortierella isabellina TaxID=91625 RepID=A0A8H7UBV1_MORIS|nr:hypothetical protein INT43_005279 [Umbelopsis isabellina]
MTLVNDTKNPQMFNASEQPPVSEQSATGPSVREVPPPPYSPSSEQKKQQSPSHTVPLDRLGEDPESILCPECGYMLNIAARDAVANSQPIPD